MKLKDIFKKHPLFHKWSQEKKLNSTDLNILTELKKADSFKLLVEWIEKHPVSHSEGKQILELGGELLLMNKSIHKLLKKCDQANTLIKELKILRFPIYHSKQKKVNI